MKLSSRIAGTLRIRNLFPVSHAHIRIEDALVAVLYSSVFILYPLFDLRSVSQPTELSAVLLSYAAFFAVYWHSFRVMGPWGWLHISVMFLLATCWLSTNPFSAVFYFYALYMICYMRPMKAIITPSITLILVATATSYFVWQDALYVGLLLLILCISLMMEISRIRHEENSFRLALSHEEINQLARLAERTKIARNLHDALGQNLTVLALRMDLTSQQLSELDNNSVREYLDQWAAHVREILQDMRNITHDEFEVGLDSELKEAEDNLNATGISLATDVNIQDLPARVENIICMILHELVTNIIRHSAASQARIKIEQLANGFSIFVRDNGKGKQARSGFGLRSVSERVTSQAGHIAFDNDNGFSVSIFLPTPSENKAEKSR